MSLSSLSNSTPSVSSTSSNSVRPVSSYVPFFRDTISGSSLSYSSRIFPKVGEKGSVRIGDYLLKIMKVENKVIQTVLAIPLPKEKSGTEAKNGNEMNEKTDRKK